MEDAQKSAALLFTHELPDPDVRLFGPVTRQFTVFPKLSIELRLQIWRASFPPARRVDLSGLDSLSRSIYSMQYGDSHARAMKGKSYASLSLSRAQFPKTLWVSQESRWETQKYYTVAFPKKYFGGMDLLDLLRLEPASPHQRCEKLPIWFNPDRDSVIVSERQLEMLDMLYDLRPSIPSQGPRFFSGLRTLEVATSWKIGAGVPFLTDMNFLLRFPSLHTVLFHVERFGHTMTEREIKDFEEILKTWLQDPEKHDTRTSISEVYFKDAHPEAPQITLFLRDGK